MALPEKMKFGIFMAPFHRINENPTLALERDLELIQWMDTLGFDEAWIGEHHSAGWETISSPEIFIGIAADRTRHIKLGTGVISLPYHHPLMVANRMVLLDHLTRGRVMLGVGPGALVTDAHMLGIDPNVQRQRMDEALGIILRLFTETEPITYVSDWFELHEAMLQVRPYTKPHMPIAVASVRSPSGPALAGKHGAAVLSMSVPRETEARSDMTYLWAVAEESAAEHGQTVDRHEWRLVLPVHLAESRDEAIQDIRLGAGQFNREYLEETLGRPLEFEGPTEKILDYLMDTGQWIIGTPDDCVEAIHRLAERSGGFGGFLIGFTQDLAPREKVLRSYELMARYVMPHFQGSLAGLQGSNQWARGRADHTREAMAHAVDVAKEAYESRAEHARSSAR